MEKLSLERGLISSVVYQGFSVSVGVFRPGSCLVSGFLCLAQGQLKLNLIFVVV